MTSKIIRTAAFSVASALSILAMTTSASATSYGDCVAATWDPIGCWLNPDYEEWGGMTIAAPGVGGANGRTIERVKAMAEKGMFKELEAGAGRISKTPYQRVCELNKVLDIFEDSGDAKKTMASCYKPAKPRAETGSAVAKPALAIKK